MLDLFVSVDKPKPYSPFQNTNSWGEYAVARLDDLLNWGRKVLGGITGLISDLIVDLIVHRTDRVIFIYFRVLCGH